MSSSSPVTLTWFWTSAVVPSRETTGAANGVVLSNARVAR
jgi:hypothetical protein